jgi:hypothetical protein
LDYHSNKLVSLFDLVNNKSRRQLAAEQHIVALNKKFGRTLVVSGSNISILEREKKKPKQEFGLVMGEVG